MVRRTHRDYEKEVSRYEEWLMLTEGDTVSRFDSIGELIDSIENWLDTIDVKGDTAVRFASSMLEDLLKKVPERSRRASDVEVAQMFGIPRAKQKWNADEIKYLNHYYRLKTVPIASIAQGLGRSYNSVRVKAQRIGVRRPR